MNHQRTLLSLALASALGVSVHAEASTITGSWTGAFALLSPTGQVFANADLNQCYPGMLIGSGCVRTAVSGTMTFNTSTGAGTGTVVPFSFTASGDMSYFAINLRAIGDGFGGPGSLILGNMNLNWNGNNGIPISIVWDAAGLFTAVGNGLSVGQTISGMGALPESNNTVYGGSTYPIGPALLATTGWNTTTISGTTFGTNPSGTLPLLSDTVMDATNGDASIGGSPMPTFPFKDYNATFDILSLQVTNIEAVPIPATVWLFGSGLAGLASFARRKRRKSPTQTG